MKLLQAFPKLGLGLVFAAGLTTAAVMSEVAPAQAGVVVSVGIGGGYAPAYHWHRWHDGYGWHRRWVAVGWAPPAYYPPAPVYGFPARSYSYGAPVVYARPYAWGYRPYPYGYGYHYAYGYHDARPGHWR